MFTLARLTTTAMQSTRRNSSAISLPYFNLEVPTSLSGVNASILDPRDTYSDVAEWDEKAKKLAEMFVSNFEQFTDNDEGKGLVEFGPQL